MPLARPLLCFLLLLLVNAKFFPFTKPDWQEETETVGEVGSNDVGKRPAPQGGHVPQRQWLSHLSSALWPWRALFSPVCESLRVLSVLNSKVVAKTMNLLDEFLGLRPVTFCTAMPLLSLSLLLNQGFICTRYQATVDLGGHLSFHLNSAASFPFPLF